MDKNTRKYKSKLIYFGRVNKMRLQLVFNMLV